jgi:hypothetical protein
MLPFVARKSAYTFSVPSVKSLPNLEEKSVSSERVVVGNNVGETEWLHRSVSIFASEICILNVALVIRFLSRNFNTS